MDLVSQSEHLTVSVAQSEEFNEETSKQMEK
jgi:hypothetical protein